jgi:hypothetical protein
MNVKVKNKTVIPRNNGKLESWNNVRKAKIFFLPPMFQCPIIPFFLGFLFYLGFGFHLKFEL